MGGHARDARRAGDRQRRPVRLAEHPAGTPCWQQGRGAHTQCAPARPPTPPTHSTHPVTPPTHPWGRGPARPRWRRRASPARGPPAHSCAPRPLLDTKVFRAVVQQPVVTQLLGRELLGGVAARHRSPQPQPPPCPDPMQPARRLPAAAELWEASPGGKPQRLFAHLLGRRRGCCRWRRGRLLLRGARRRCRGGLCLCRRGGCLWRGAGRVCRRRRLFPLRCSHQQVRALRGRSGE